MPKFRSKAAKANLGDLHTRGSTLRKGQKAEGAAEESGKSSLNPISKLLGQNDSKSALKIGRDDDEMDYTAWDADDLDMRQLLERLQLHHDSMEREFLDQKEEVSKLQDILQKEADELKSLLASNRHRIYH